MAHSDLWWALDDLEAPYFLGVPCSTCRVPAGEYCNTGAGKAHASRVNAGLREANRTVNSKEN